MSENAWIEWRGGDQPVDDDARVDIRLKDGRVWFNVRAGNLSGWRWRHSVTGLSFGYIIAYRLSGPSA